MTSIYFTKPGVELKHASCWGKVKLSLEVPEVSTQEEEGRYVSQKTPEKEWDSWKQVLESGELFSKKVPSQWESESRGIDDSWDSWEESYR